MASNQLPNRSSDISFMHPILKAAFLKLSQQAALNNLSFIITQVARSKQYQEALFAQGRKSLSQVNTLRKAIGELPLTEKQNKIVTWTIASKHIPKIFPPDQQPYSRAFDVAIIDPKKQIQWSEKVDINQNQKKDYEELGLIGESLGLIWGGRFRDVSHFEI